MPLISVIVVTYNAGLKVFKTLNSIFKQLYTNFEVIVIDGGSTDDTLVHVLPFKDKLAYFVSEPDRGIYDAMNKGIDKANGEFCIFLNAGDVFFSEESLLTVCEMLQNNAEIVFFVGNAVYDYESSGLYKFYPQFKSLPYSFCHQSMFFRTNVIKHYHYDISYKLSGDSELFYRLIQNNIKMKFFDVILIREEAGDGATIHNLYSSAKELYSIPYITNRIGKGRRVLRLLKIKVFAILHRFLPMTILLLISRKQKYA